MAKRTNRDITESLTPTQVYGLATQREREYQTNQPYYHLRDTALVAFIFLLACRVNEALKVKANQLTVQNSGNRILVKDFLVSKRKEATLKRFGPKLLDIPIYLANAPFVEDTAHYKLGDLVFCHWHYVKKNMQPHFENVRLFPMGRSYAYRIVNEITDKWPHYFRSQGLSYWTNILDNPLAVGQIFGIENIQTLNWYYKGAWRVLNGK